jgi:hypothetical protein
MILDIHPGTLLLVGLLISVGAPKPILQGLWIGGMLWLLIAAAISISADLGTRFLVIGQMIAWLLPGLIVAARTLLDPDNTPYGAYGRNIDRQQLVELLAVLGSVTDPDPEDPQHQQQVPAPLAQWHQNDGDDPDGGNDADVFGGLDLDTDPLHDDPD